MAVDRDAEKAPPIIENFVRQVIVTNKAVMLYPAGSDIPRDNAAAACKALDVALEEIPDLTLSVTKQGLYFEDLPLFPGQPTFYAFSQELYNRRLASVRFHSGVTIDHLIGFLLMLKLTPDEILAGGGYEAMMWERGVSSITVLETQVSLVDQIGDDSDDGSGNPIDVPTVAVQKRTGAPRSRERIEITRVMGNDKALRDYLTRHTDDSGEELSLPAMEKRFAELAQIAAEETGARADGLARLFAQALWTLEPNLRQELIETQMLPEAKSSEAMAGAMRRIDLHELVRMLAEGDEGFDTRRTGFTRALKNLVQINAADRGQIASAATDVLRSEGVDEGIIGRVVADATPTRLTVRRTMAAPRTLDSAAAMVLQLIDRAPLSATADGSDDPEIAAVQEEAACGLDESDVIAALVSIAGLEADEQQFANIMSALEDTLDLLVARGEIEAAAEAAITLVDAARNPDLRPGQCQRLENAIARFARPEDIRTITHALRIYSPGQPEYDAAQRLISTLGVLAIRPLLEQLATEQDRAERKALVDLISKDAAQYVTELGTHVGDPRWYFVRNVVAILASTKSPSILGPLERPLRNSDARVRRETIRALSVIHERRAVDMLVSALDDEDPHNVQLAARYLASSNGDHVVPALEAVARGEGHGNRDNGPRVEAIEALGRMRAGEALPTLQAIARKRSIIGGGRLRELRSAAEAAIAAINAPGGAK